MTTDLHVITPQPTDTEGTSKKNKTKMQGHPAKIKNLLWREFCHIIKQDAAMTNQMDVKPQLFGKDFLRACAIYLFIYTSVAFLVDISIFDCACPKQLCTLMWSTHLPLLVTLCDFWYKSFLTCNYVVWSWFINTNIFSNVLMAEFAVSILPARHDALHSPLLTEPHKLISLAPSNLFSVNLHFYATHTSGLTLPLLLAIQKLPWHRGERDSRLLHFQTSPVEADAHFLRGWWVCSSDNNSDMMER